MHAGFISAASSGVRRDHGGRVLMMPRPQAGRAAAERSEDASRRGAGPQESAGILLERTVRGTPHGSTARPLVLPSDREFAPPRAGWSRPRPFLALAPLRQIGSPTLRKGACRTDRARQPGRSPRAASATVAPKL